MAKSILVTVTNDLNQDQRMHRICSTLAEEGYDVMLLGRKKADSAQLLEHTFNQLRLRCIFSGGFLFYLEYNIRILWYALRKKPDAIYTVDLDTLLGGGIASWILRSKLIHDAHEYFVEVPELEGSKLKKSIWNWIGKRFVPKSDLCITVNHELAEILSEKYGNSFDVIRSVPSTQIGSEEINAANNPPVILYQGVLNKGRGLEEAIDAVHGLDGKVVLKIAGEGDLSHELRSQVQKLKAEKLVNFLGWLTPEELKKQTANADIGLNLLSASSLNYKYSLANKFFDYMHAGVPSINMDFPVYRRICGQYEVGLCIESLDTECIKQAILTIVTDEERKERMKKACKIARTQYNWERESSKLVQLVAKRINR